MLLSYEIYVSEYGRNKKCAGKLASTTNIDTLMTLFHIQRAESGAPDMGDTNG